MNKHTELEEWWILECSVQVGGYCGWGMGEDKETTWRARAMTNTLIRFADNVQPRATGMGIKSVTVTRNASVPAAAAAAAAR